MKKGRAATMAHDYKRNGTTTLFAALNVLNGQTIAEIFRRSRNNYGCRKIKAELSKQGLFVSKKRIIKIMKEQNLVSNYHKAKFKKHSKKCNEQNIANKLKRDFAPSSYNPLQAVVSDLTYVSINGLWHYICILLDLCTREIVGYSAARQRTANLVE